MILPEPIRTELVQLFARMDLSYAQAAAAHGFVCSGCDQNCCRTRFYHHALAECLYLREGLAGMTPEIRQRVLQRAAAAVRIMSDEGNHPPATTICPLNENDACILYPHRPMICRLHGIPHQLRRPDGQRQVGPGCNDFDRQCGPSRQVLLDRTPLYTALADLERRLRGQSGFDRKIRMTIAQILTEPFFDRITLPPSGKSDEIY